MSLFQKVTRFLGSGGEAPDFPYTLGEEIIEYKQAQDCGIIWKMYDGRGTNDDEEVSIFVCEKKEAMSFRLDAANNCVQKLKTIRHPDILQFLRSAETDDRILIATESVRPLSASIDRVGRATSLDQDGFREVGLNQVATALQFIHETVGLVHGSISPATIFINRAGDFKVGGLELMHKYGDIPSFFSSNFDLLPTRYKPRECQSGVECLSRNPIHSLDAWCLGCSIYELFNGRFSRPQQLSSFGSIPKQLQPQYKRLLAGKPGSRLRASQVTASDYFDHPLAHAVTFLNEIALKSDDEKRQFYQTLQNNVSTFPSGVCQYKILPALSHALEHGSGSNPVVLACVLGMAKQLNEDQYEKVVRPLVVGMFQNNERGTRINLLKNIDKYIDGLDVRTVSNDIFPNVLNGFTDTSPVLREATVRSVLHFAPKLNAACINDKLLPTLIRLLSDTEAPIRTNTTIVIGKMTKFVDMSKHQVTIVKGLARSLKDPFHPSRSAALSAFQSSMGIFQPAVLAKQVVPMIATLTVDPYKSVRDSAFKCLEVGIQRLKQHAHTMPDKPPDPAEAKEGDTTKQALQQTSSTAAAALATAGGWMASSASKLWKGDESETSTEDKSKRIGELKSKPIPSSLHNSRTSSGTNSNRNNISDGYSPPKTSNRNRATDDNFSISSDDDEDDDVFGTSDAKQNGMDAMDDFGDLDDLFSTSTKKRTSNRPKKPKSPRSSKSKLKSKKSKSSKPKPLSPPPEDDLLSMDFGSFDPMNDGEMTFDSQFDPVQTSSTNSWNAEPTFGGDIEDEDDVFSMSTKPKKKKKQVNPMTGLKSPTQKKGMTLTSQNKNEFDVSLDDMLTDFSASLSTTSPKTTNRSATSANPRNNRPKKKSSKSSSGKAKREFDDFLDNW